MRFSAAWFGDRAVVVDVADPDQREWVAQHLARLHLPGDAPIEVRRGMRSVLVETPDPEPALLEFVLASLGDGHEAEPVRESTSSVVEMPVVYDGEDLAEVAHLLHVPALDVVRCHQMQSWRVAMMGFAPGFGYLEPVGLPRLDWAALPRRATPRTRVPRGSVAVAAGMSAVYPNPSPGGWHLLGTTERSLFDVDRHPPAVLVPGAIVRFAEAKGRP